MALQTGTVKSVLTPPGSEVKVKAQVWTTATATTAALKWSFRKGTAIHRVETQASTSIGTVTLSIGSASTTNHYVSAFALTTNAAAVQLVTPVLNNLVTTEMTADTDIYAQISAAPSAGTLTVRVYYSE